ncbi:MAG: hypothetical protein HY579_00135 [Nitrospinae bacterium]|nr:hypothetical protein [Nitrospinota bacterium]
MNKPMHNASVNEAEGELGKWSANEMRLLRMTELFQLKPAIMKKAESYLDELKNALALELTQGTYPPGAELTNGRLTRGENNKGFPFLSLDIPQLFTKTEYFTFRALFWWGHYLGFSLILKGKKLPEQTANLLANQKQAVCRDIYLSCAPTPWEWERTEDNFKNLYDTPGGEIRGIVESVQYLKLCRFYPFDEPGFDALEWAPLGVQTFRDFNGLTAVS